MALFRTAVKNISPGVLRAGTGERYMYAMAVIMDAFMQKAVEAGLAHMPTRCDPSFLPVIGSDRLIGQGLTEPTSSYRVRLQRAFESWQLAGSARSVLGQVLGFLLASTPRVRIVGSRYTGSGASYPPVLLSSQWDTYEAGQNPSSPPVHYYVDVAGGGTAGEWDWDSVSQ
ncbi:MAG: hypothetical protein ACM3O6_11380, partial [Acidobacteriota bacterium]